MKLRKFQATTMREAIAEVRRELGPDAMVVSTRQIRRGLLGSGVEVTAAVENEEAEPAPAAPPVEAARAGGGLGDADVERIMAPLRSELRSLRAMIRPLAAADGTDELRAEIQALRRALIDLRRPGDCALETSLEEVAAGGTLCAPSERRVVGLIGPTGVGKTTTIAKLAARAALLEQRSVALVTLNTYRVGGEEQIRTFADLMGVPLRLVADPGRLGEVVASLSGVERIYIDTAGRSPRDAEAIAALEHAFGTVSGAEVHLAVSASSRGALIDTCMRRYRNLKIDRLLFTKIDEADDLSELVRAPARLGIPVAYITTGQRVPEDLEDATASRLLQLAAGSLSFDERGDERGGPPLVEPARAVGA